MSHKKNSQDKDLFDKLMEVLKGEINQRLLEEWVNIEEIKNKKKQE